MPEKEPLNIYIVGRGHSGSTLLELMLNRSANIAAMGEIDMLSLQQYRDHRTRWVGQCSCGARPHACEIWGQVLRLIEREHGVDLANRPFGWRLSDVGVEEEYGWRRPDAMLWYKAHRLVRTLSYGRHGLRPTPFTPLYRRWIHNRDFVVRHYARLRNVEAVVDASKDPLQMRDIVAHSHLPYKILFLTRDVRGLAWSAVRKQRSSAAEEAADWSRLNARILRLLEGVPPAHWTQVRYEALCGDPAGELARIHDFLGIERQPLSPAQELARRHTIAGNKVRYQVLDEVREDTAWREHLSAGQLAEIDRVARPVALRLGYD